MPSQQSHERPLAELIEELEGRGITDRQSQADELGMALPTLKRHLREQGLTKRPSLDEWIPWTVRAEHHSDPTARKLRILAQAAQGRQTRYRLKRGQAVTWARGLVEQGLDVTYSREAGFSTVRARRNDWYLKRLLDAAMKFVANLPQLDDLGEDTN